MRIVLQVLFGVACITPTVNWCVAQTPIVDGAVAGEFPDRSGLGVYSIVRGDEPVRRTQKEEQKIIAVGVPTTKRVSMELRGKVVVPKGCGISVAVMPNSNGSIRETIDQLDRMPGEVIWAITITEELDGESLRTICKWKGLRDMTLLKASEVEGENGARCLSQLKALRYLNIGNGGSYEFGSKALCEAIVSLDKLKMVIMPCEKLRESDCAMLAQHESLESLFLLAKRPILGAPALAAFSRAPRLRELSVVCTPDITNADVMAFAECRSLELLSIASDARIDCMARFQQRLPDCRLSIRGVLE